MKVGGRTYGPNTMPTYTNVTPTESFRQHFFEAPIDEKQTRIFFLNMRNFILDPSKDGPIHARNKIIAGQDIQILDTLDPIRTPISNTKEVLMPADGPIAAYRDWLARFDEKGWHIAWDEFARRKGHDTTFCYPQPWPT